MAVVVANETLTLIDDADSGILDTANDTASPALDTDIKVQGVGSTACKVSGTSTVSGMAHDEGAGSTIDLSSTHIYMWAFTMHKVNTKALGGWRIRVSSNNGATNNFGEWYVGGSDSNIGANLNFQSFAVDTTKAFDAQGGTPPALTAVRTVGIFCDFLTSNGRISLFVDEMKHGDGGIRITGGTGGSPGTFSEIVNDATTGDKTVGRGVMTSVGGIFFTIGKLRFGDTAGVTSTVFRDSNFVVVFEDMPVAATHNEIILEGNATGTNEVKFGSEVGTAPNSIGSGGGLFKSLGPLFRITATDANLNICDFLGTLIDGAGAISWGQTNARMISCTIANSGLITLSNGAELRDSIIDSATGTAVSLLSNPVDPEFRDNVIQNSSIGITVAQSITGNTLDLRNIKFNGNTNDIEVTGTGAFTINILEGGDTPANILTPGGAVVTVNSAVSVQVTVKDETSSPILGAQVLVQKISGKTDLITGSTNASGIVSGSILANPGDVSVIVRKAAGGLNDFDSVSRTENIGASDVSFSVTLFSDPININ